MRRTRNLLTTLALLGGLGLIQLATPAARAGLIPNKVTIAPEGGNFRWTYNVVVTSDLYVAKGDYFTIYDFGAATDVQMPAGWAMTTGNTTSIPPKYGHVNANDDPNIPNYTFTYTGSTPIFGSAGLGNFSFLVTGSEKSDSVFTSVNHRQDNSTNDPDPQEFTLTPTAVPVASAGASTPEPATLILAACGLPLAGLLRLRRRRR
jgi:hypothetical protein